MENNILKHTYIHAYIYTLHPTAYTADASGLVCMINFHEYEEL